MQIQTLLPRVAIILITSVNILTNIAFEHKCICSWTWNHIWNHKLLLWLNPWPRQASDEVLLWARNRGRGLAGPRGLRASMGLVPCFVLRSKLTSLFLSHAAFILLPDSHCGPRDGPSLPSPARSLASWDFSQPRKNAVPPAKQRSPVGSATDGEDEAAVSVSDFSKFESKDLGVACLLLISLSSFWRVP